MAVAVCTTPVFVLRDAPISHLTATHASSAHAHAHAPHPAPLELIKIIFDLAARSSLHTALTLTHVCKTARQWALPILYETVEMDNARALSFQRSARPCEPSTSGQTTTTNAAELEHTPNDDDVASSPPFQYIRNLRATCLPDPHTLSHNCPNLESLSIANYDMRHIPRLATPALKRLTVTGSMRYCDLTAGVTSTRDTSHPLHSQPHSSSSSSPSILQSITHLRFADDVPRLSEELMTGMEELTHFSCSYTPGHKKRGRSARVAQPRQLEVRGERPGAGAVEPNSGKEKGEIDLEHCIDAVLKAPKVKRVVVCVKGGLKERERVRQLVGDGEDGRVTVEVVAINTTEEMDVWGDGCGL